MALQETLLIAEDEPLQRKMLTMLLEKSGYQVVAVADGHELVQHIEADGDRFAAVLLDISMPVMDGFSTLRSIRRYYPDLPVIMITAESGAEMAVKAIREGAYDYMVKPPDPEHLLVVVGNAIRMRSMSRELVRMKRDKEGALSFDDLVGSTGGLSEVVALGRKASASEVPVLIMGETGAGKELFARAIHGESRRVGAPFVAINCGAIPPNLIESTLFGHEKGAFTGAVGKSLGKFREAEGGTVFLDEIGELPPEAQVRLLRVLQQKEVEPVGAGKPVKVNVRIISATHRDLKLEVKQGRFREDLFFRLNVLPLTIPPLRERTQDIVPLAEYFTKRCASMDMVSPKPLATDAVQYLLRYHWPGNVRELENLVRRVLVLSDGDIVTAADLQRMHDNTSGVEEVSFSASAGGGLAVSLMRADGSIKTMDEVEQETIRTILEHTEQNISRAADILGIAKSTFYRKIKK